MYKRCKLVVFIFVSIMLLTGCGDNDTDNNTSNTDNNTGNTSEFNLSETITHIYTSTINNKNTIEFTIQYPSSWFLDDNESAKYPTIMKEDAVTPMILRQSKVQMVIGTFAPSASNSPLEQAEHILGVAGVEIVEGEAINLELKQGLILERELGGYPASCAIYYGKENTQSVLCYLLIDEEANHTYQLQAYLLPSDEWANLDYVFQIFDTFAVQSITAEG